MDEGLQCSDGGLGMTEPDAAVNGDNGVSENVSDGGVGMTQHDAAVNVENGGEEYVSDGGLGMTEADAAVNGVSGAEDNVSGGGVGITQDDGTSVACSEEDIALRKIQEEWLNNGDVLVVDDVGNSGDFMQRVFLVEDEAGDGYTEDNSGGNGQDEERGTRENNEAGHAQHGEEPNVESQAHSSTVEKPAVGMQFLNGEDFVAHVHRYAFENGFQARIRSSEKHGDSEDCVRRVETSGGFVFESHFRNKTKIRMTCNKGGKFKSLSKDPNRSTQSCKTNCMFRVNARRNSADNSCWTITWVNDLHNHDFEAPDARHFARYKRIGISDRQLIYKLHESGVSVPHIYNVFVNQYKGYRNVPFDESNMRNLLFFESRKPLRGGDFAAMEVHFKKMREETPGFFYEYDVDKDHRLKSVFWADSRCREAYKEFGDIITFDTTFVKNRYRMPFAPFIGVNHHGKSMLFGCALLGKEDTDSFVWLFETWKKCMGNAPIRILTDQERAIGKAIEIVFPGTKHRWCIWHVMRNARKNLGCLSCWKELAVELLGSLHDSRTIEEFECRWKETVVKHGLEGNSWLLDMYAKRDKWVPVFFKSDFWAGMSSTQRSEGMNNFFKGYVNINTHLYKFVEQYGKAVGKRIKQEETDTFNGSNLKSRETTSHPFEPVFENMFTRAKFIEFHKELTQMSYNTASKVSENGNEVVYDVHVKKFRFGWTRKRNYTVSLDRSTLDVKCDCLNFEFTGILCAHALRVFCEEETLTVPEKYIFRRWRKDIPRKYMKENYPKSIFLNKGPIGFQRYEAMHTVCDEICVMLMNNDGLYKDGLVELRAMKDKLVARLEAPDGIKIDVLNGIGRVYGRKRPGDADKEVERTTEIWEQESSNSVRDPIDKRGRGRGPMKRKASFLDRVGGEGPSNVGEEAPSKRGRKKGSRGRGRGSVTRDSGPSSAPSSQPQMQFRPHEGGWGGQHQTGERDAGKIPVFGFPGWRH